MAGGLHGFPGMKRKKPSADLCRRIVAVYDGMEISTKLLCVRFELPNTTIVDILHGRLYKTIKSAKIRADGELSPHTVIKPKPGKIDPDAVDWHRSQQRFFSSPMRGRPKK